MSDGGMCQNITAGGAWSRPVSGTTWLSLHRLAICISEGVQVRKGKDKNGAVDLAEDGASAWPLIWEYSGFYKGRLSTCVCFPVSVVGFDVPV